MCFSLSTEHQNHSTLNRSHAEQLKPQEFEAACLKKGQTLTIRMHEGYDHSYFFISSFIDDHVDFHADALGL